VLFGGPGAHGIREREREGERWEARRVEAINMDLAGVKRDTSNKKYSACMILYPYGPVTLTT
jgi:hypothetical protein